MESGRTGSTTNGQERRSSGLGPPPAKSIILFSDGTGNSSATLFKTNVWRMYEAVDLGPASAGKQRQIAFYDNGVGTSAFRPLRMIQGVFGAGLRRNVLEIYRYACRNYDPDSVPIDGSDIDEKGDHIYGFGFSRGAFTMRLVIGLIADQGLVPYVDEADLDRRSVAAWKAFRRNRLPRIWARLRELRGRAPESDAPPVRRGYDPSLHHRPVIRFIGVWDTVSAYGGPIAEITRAIDNWLYPLSMPNYRLNPRVRCARHALALDDERDSFHPLLWDELAERELAKEHGRSMPWLTKKGEDRRLQQVWFSGMHADVGGGYPDESLSYISLLWMIEEAEEQGLRTLDEITGRYVALANSFGPLHDSRSGPGGYYRYQPRRMSAWLDPVDHRTLSLRDPTIRSGGRARGLIRKPVVHESVIARIASGTDGYAPIVLPRRYAIVPSGRLGEMAEQATTGGDQPRKPPRGRQRRQALLPPHVHNWLSPPAQTRVAAAMEAAWDLVLWRRIVYFLTLAATMFLLAMPWWLPPLPAGTEWSEAPWLLALVAARLSDIVGAIGVVVPAFLEKWIDTWKVHPFWFLAFALLILALMRLGGRIERRIRDIARENWHDALPRIPPATAAMAPAGKLERGLSRLGRVRNSARYQWALQEFKWQFLPNFVVFPGLMFLGLLAIYWFFR